MPQKEKEKKEFKKDVKPSKDKEVMMITTKPIKIPGKKNKETKANTSQDKGKAKLSLKEFEAKVYHFSKL